MKFSRSRLPVSPLPGPQVITTPLTRRSLDRLPQDQLKTRCRRDPLLLKKRSGKKRKTKNDQSSQMGSAGLERLKAFSSKSSSFSSVFNGLTFSFKDRNPELTIVDVLWADPTGTMTLSQNLHRSLSSSGSAPQWGQRTVSLADAVFIFFYLIPGSFFLCLISAVNSGKSSCVYPVSHFNSNTSCSRPTPQRSISFTIKRTWGSSFFLSLARMATLLLISFFLPYRDNKLSKSGGM